MFGGVIRTALFYLLSSIISLFFMTRKRVGPKAHIVLAKHFVEEWNQKIFLGFFRLHSMKFDTLHCTKDRKLMMRQKCLITFPEDNFTTHNMYNVSAFRFLTWRKIKQNNRLTEISDHRKTYFAFMLPLFTSHCLKTWPYVQNKHVIYCTNF